MSEHMIVWLTVAEIIPYGYAVWSFMLLALSAVCMFCFYIDIKLNAKTLMGKCGAASLLMMSVSFFSIACYLLWWSIWRWHSNPEWMVHHWATLVFVCAGVVSTSSLMITLTIPHALGLTEKAK